LSYKVLKTRSAVVIGGTSGIGRALSLGLAKAGADVVATSRQARIVEEVATEIEACGVRTIRRTSDVSDRGSLVALRNAVISEFGRVDILVNCAGRTKRIPTLQCDDATWNEIMDTNLTGTLRACQVFGAHMIERRYGRIINIASLATFVAFHEVAAYGASKAAVGALTKSLAVEWSSFGVTVNAIAPGLFPTDLNRALLYSPRGDELKMRTPMARFWPWKRLHLLPARSLRLTEDFLRAG